MSIRVLSEGQFGNVERNKAIGTLAGLIGGRHDHTYDHDMTLEMDPITTMRTGMKYGATSPN